MRRCRRSTRPRCCRSECRPVLHRCRNPLAGRAATDWQGGCTPNLQTLAACMRLLSLASPCATATQRPATPAPPPALPLPGCAPSRCARPAASPWWPSCPSRTAARTSPPPATSASIAPGGLTPISSTALSRTRVRGGCGHPACLPVCMCGWQGARACRGPGTCVAGGGHVAGCKTEPAACSSTAGLLTSSAALPPAGYEPTSMRAIRARYNPYVQVGPAQTMSDLVAAWGTH